MFLCAEKDIKSAPCKIYLHGIDEIVFKSVNDSSFIFRKNMQNSSAIYGKNPIEVNEKGILFKSLEELISSYLRLFA